MGEMIAWIDGANERKKDTDLRGAMIVRTLRLVNGDKMAPSLHAIAGYHEPANILAFEPEAARELALATKNAANEEKRAREHREWLDGFEVLP